MNFQNGHTMVQVTKSSGAGSEDLLGGTGKAEAATLPGAGIGPKQCPRKCAAEKGQLAEISENRQEEHTCTKRAARTMRRRGLWSSARVVGRD